MGFGVWGVGCGLWGVGCGAWGVGCGVWFSGFGFRGEPNHARGAVCNRRLIFGRLRLFDLRFHGDSLETCGFHDPSCVEGFHEDWGFPRGDGGRVGLIRLHASVLGHRLGVRVVVGCGFRGGFRGARERERERERVRVRARESALHFLLPARDVVH